MSARAAAVVVDLAFRRKVAKLHSKGPRAVAELLAHIAADRSIYTVIDTLLDRYGSLDSEALAVTGGDRLPPIPFTRVPR